MSDLAATPGQTVGPFFHYALAYRADNELVPPGSVGAIRLHGTVFDGDGAPIPDALIEIRQDDAQGRVPRVEGSLRRDGRFTGWGRAATDSAGRYVFTTVLPAGVDSGPAFFGVTVFARGLLDRLFTRAYLPGEHDEFLDALAPQERESLQIVQDDQGYRFDIHLQGERETVFLDHRPGE